MKIRPVGAEFFHAAGWTEGRADGRSDRQTERYDKASSRFPQFVNTPKITFCTMLTHLKLHSFSDEQPY